MLTNIFVGSFGLVAVAPLTALIGAAMYNKKTTVPLENRR
jgi:uncharacterized membrane protein